MNMISKYLCRAVLVGAGLSISLAGRASAEVEVIGFWKFSGPDGHAEGAPIAGDVVAAEVGPELLIKGKPTYSKDAPDTGITTGSIFFNPGDSLYLDEVITKEVDCMGMEIWVRSEKTDSAMLVLNGSSQPGFGYGLQQGKEKDYVAIYPGVTYVNSPDTTIPIAGEWTHLALVRDSEGAGTQLYANGELIYASERYTPVPFFPDKDGNAAFSIAGSMMANRALLGKFTGNIAMVRVFRFNPGEFKVEDLLYQKK